jgi:serine/threonine protein kinase
VTEKIEGGKSLEDVPADGFGDDLVAIVDALHAANVVHRDILPSNFLVAPDGHLKLIDFQFAVDMATKKVDPWLLRRPTYHFLVFAAAIGPTGAWWDDAAFVDFLFPFLRERLRSRIGRLRFVFPFSPLVRLRLRLLANGMKLQRLFTRDGSRKRQSIDRRLERFSWLSSS